MRKIYKVLYVILIIFIVSLQSIKVYADDEISINAKAGIIVELNTGKVIYEKNSKEQNYPASVTKILTAIIVIENSKLDDVATASETAISMIPAGYVVAPLSVGEKMNVEDLLYALMLKSANDAAYVLAEHVGGSIDKFSDMMNNKAKEIGCKNSHFVNPNGIHNDEHYTTAYDMYLISDYAMKNETFAKIVSTYEYTLPATNKYKNTDRVMKNSNNFVNPNSSYYNKSVKGIKTGTTTQAGNCLITYASKDGLDFINVVLGAETSNGKFNETNKMIKYSFDNYTLTKMHEKGEKIKTIEVEKATEETKKLDLLISESITVMNNKKTTKNQITPEINLNEEIEAPIIKGQELGTIKYVIEDIEYNAKLLAANDVEKRTYYKEIAIAVGVVVIIIVVLVIVKKRLKRQIL